MTTGDDYKVLRCDLLNVTGDAIEVMAQGKACWIPRSLLSYKSDKDVSKISQIPYPMTLKVRAWKLAALKLIGHGS